jgi:hypothetical protein
MLEHVDLQATGSSSGLMQLFTKIEQIGSMGQASGLFLCLIALYSALLLCRGVYGGLYERLRSFPLSPWAGHGRPRALQHLSAPARGVHAPASFFFSTADMLSVVLCWRVGRLASRFGGCRR